MRTRTLYLGWIIPEWEETLMLDGFWIPVIHNTSILNDFFENKIVLLDAKFKSLVKIRPLHEQNKTKLSGNRKEHLYLLKGMYWNTVGIVLSDKIWEMLLLIPGSNQEFLVIFGPTWHRRTRNISKNSEQCKWRNKLLLSSPIREYIENKNQQIIRTNKTICEDI